MEGRGARGAARAREWTDVVREVWHGAAWAWVEGGRVHEWTYEVGRWTDDEREVRRGAAWVNVAGSARASSLGQ